MSTPKSFAFLGDAERRIHLNKLLTNGLFMYCFSLIISCAISHLSAFLSVRLYSGVKRVGQWTGAFDTQII